MPCVVKLRVPVGDAAHPALTGLLVWVHGSGYTGRYWSWYTVWVHGSVLVLVHGSVLVWVHGSVLVLVHGSVLVWEHG